MQNNSRDWYYFPIEMPVTKAGWGPATVGLDAYRITYCVWDKLFNEYGSFDNLYDAMNEAMRLNNEIYVRPLEEDMTYEEYIEFVKSLTQQMFEVTDILGM
jgi:hypothetical protein